MPFVCVPLEPRFWAKVDRLSPDGCWPWVGYINPHGYGMTTVNKRPRRAHAVAWEIANGRPLAPGMVACHACDVRHCCRNDGDEGIYVINGVARIRYGHIWEGTRAENIADTVAKGRHATGDRTGSRVHPERLARGDRNGARKYPERMLAGARKRLESGIPWANVGERHGLTHITNAQAIEIRRLWAAGGLRQCDIAARFGTSQRAVSDIVRNKTFTRIQ